MAQLSGINVVAQAISNEFGLEFVTIREKARVLRDAGYIAKQKGGRGGGHLSSREAVHLLISSAGTTSRQRSLIPVQQHGACRADQEPWKLKFEGLPRLANLASDHTLTDLLDCLVLSAIAGDVDPRTGVIKPLNGGTAASELSVRISMSEPWLWTDVSIGLHGPRNANGEPTFIAVTEKVYKFTFAEDGEFIPAVTSDSADFADLSHKHSFSERVILKVAEALRDF